MAVRRPNIVFIMSDDHAAHAGGRNTLYLDGHVETKNKVTVVIASSAENVWDATGPTQLADR